MRERTRTDGTRESESIEMMVFSLFANEQRKTWRGGHVWMRALAVVRKRRWMRRHKRQQHHAQTTVRWHKTSQQQQGMWVCGSGAQRW